MSGPYVLTLDRAAYDAALAALGRLGATDLGRTLGLDVEIMREARTAFPDGPAMLRPPAIARYVVHLRRALAHQSRQRLAPHVLILDAKQYKTLWIALWLCERAGFTGPRRRPGVSAGQGPQPAAPEKGLTVEDTRAFIAAVRKLGRHAAWT